MKLILSICTICSIFLIGCSSAQQNSIEITNPQLKQDCEKMFSETDSAYKQGVLTPDDVDVLRKKWINSNNLTVSDRKVLLDLTNLDIAALQKQDSNYQEIRTELVSILGEPAQVTISSDNSNQSSSPSDYNASGLVILPSNIVNVAGNCSMDIMIINKSNQSVFVSPIDFTLASPSNVINPYQDTYNYFQGTTLQAGQQMHTKLIFTDYNISKFNELDYNGIAGRSQTEVNIPSNQ